MTPTIAFISLPLLFQSLLQYQTCTAFTLLPLSLPKKHSTSSLPVSRKICSFESSDFALPSNEWPYSVADLSRLDGSDDSYFYDNPRFVTHIDDNAIASLTEYYREEMTALYETKSKSGRKDRGLDVLDICSSWVSHLPADVPLGEVFGVGMNEEELSANPQLTDYQVQDLNKEPSLSFLPDSSFDMICNVVSVDYLTNPKELFQEMHRVLRPGGVALMSFSNRCFPSKAVAMWLQADDIGRMTIVGSYFHYSNCEWKSIDALDLKVRMKSPSRPGLGDMFKNPSLGMAWVNTASAVSKGNSGDPMFAVKATR